MFTVNLAQIRSAVPEIFEAQTKKSQTVLKTEPCLLVVKNQLAQKIRIVVGEGSPEL